MKGNNKNEMFPYQSEMMVRCVFVQMIKIRQKFNMAELTVERCIVFSMRADVGRRFPFCQSS